MKGFSNINLDKKNLIFSGIGVAAGLGLSMLINWIKNKNTLSTKPVKIEKPMDVNSEQYKAILEEQLVRNIQFFGYENQMKICNSFIIIVGIGGVGSHVLSAVIRSGVKKIRIIDFDRVTLSSLNRHAYATREDVGSSKVDCSNKFIKKIFPHIEVEIFEEFLNDKNIERLLAGNPNYVIDCIDNIDAKVALLAYCVKNKIKVICSCGAGMKADPTRMQIRDISESKYDDLARAVRVKLKKHNVSKGIVCVYSTERTERELLPLQEHQKEDPDNFRLLTNYRVRIVPVLGTMPAIMGLSIASWVLCEIAGQPYKPHVLDEVKSNNYLRIHQILINSEKKRGVPESEQEFDLEDIYILARDVFEWECAISGKKHQSIEAVRWDPIKKANIRNIVLLSGQVAKDHLKITNLPGPYTTEQMQRVENFQKKLEIVLKKKNPVYFN